MYLATVIDAYSRKLAGYGIRRPDVGLTGQRCFSSRTGPTPEKWTHRGTGP